MNRSALVSLVGSGLVGAGQSVDRLDLNRLLEAVPAPAGVSRRSFLTAIGLAAPAALALAALDPERLLWVPGEKAIFLPPERSVVRASAADLWALRLAMGGLYFPDGPGRQVYRAFDVSKAALLSDREYELAVQVGHKMIANQPAVAPRALRMGFK